jgi:hypothetical protein
MPKLHTWDEHSVCQYYQHPCEICCQNTRDRPDINSCSSLLRVVGIHGGSLGLCRLGELGKAGQGADTLRTGFELWKEALVEWTLYPP